MTYRIAARRLALLAGGALFVSAGFTASTAQAQTAATATAGAASAAPDRDYLPGNILVTADRENYLEDDGSTATKTPTPLIKVPQAVTVITADQIEDQAITQLNDALRYVPGVSLETGEGHRDEVFIRGQESTADFYLDGLRDDAQYYRPLYNIERVEVLKGANALIFGRAAGGGAINRVAKKADPNAQFVALNAQAGTFGQGAIMADVNLPTSMDTAFRLNAAYERFDNHRDVYEGDFIGISPGFTAELGPDTRLTAVYSYDRNEQVVDRGVPSFNGAPLRGFDEAFFGDSDLNRTTADVHIARTRLEHDFSSALSGNLTLQYANYDKAYANLFPRGTNGTTVQFSGYRDTQERENLIAQGNLVWQGQTGAIGHTLLAGAEFIRQDSQNTRANVLFDTAGGQVTTVSVALQQQLAFPDFALGPLIRNNDSSLETISFYLQDQIALADWIEVVAGIRYDEFRLDTVDLAASPVQANARTDKLWSPRLGLIVQPTEALSLYASYSESFLPQAGDQFFILNQVTAGLEPEKFENSEIGIKWAVRPDLFFTAAAFRLDRTNTRAADPNNTGLTVLTGESRTEGVELSLAGTLVPNLNVNLGYTYLDGEITAASNFGGEGNRLQQLPRHQLGLWGRYDLTDRLGLGTGVIHQSDQFASFSNNVVLPSYTRVDAAVFFDVNDRLGLQLNIENLFDADYYASAHGDNNIQPGRPLNATLAARLRF